MKANENDVVILGTGLFYIPIIRKGAKVELVSIQNLR